MKRERVSAPQGGREIDRPTYPDLSCQTTSIDSLPPSAQIATSPSAIVIETIEIKI